MTIERQQSLEELITKTEVYFKTLSYSSTTIHMFRIGWQALDEYMKIHSISFYNSMAGEAFIKSIVGTGSYAELSTGEKHIIRSTNVLTEYQTTGTVKFRSASKVYEFRGEIGDLILDFISPIGSLKDFQMTL